MTALGLLGLILLSPLQDGNEWAVKEDQAAEYKVLDSRNRKATGETFTVLGWELLRDGENRIAVDRAEMIPFHFLFRLPGGALNKGSRRELGADFFRWGEVEFAGVLPSLEAVLDVSGVKPVRAQGTVQVVKVDAKTGEAQIEGSFTFFEIQRDLLGGGALRVTKNKIGTLRTTQVFDPKQGVLKQGAYVLTLRGQERAPGGRGAPTREKKYSLRGMIEFDRVVTLKPDNLSVEASASIQKGVEWLKGVQKRSGDFGEVVADGINQPMNVTPLAARALLAGGTKADEKPLELALRFAERAPKRLVPEVAGTILLFGRAKGKEEAELIKKMASALSGLADEQMGTWQMAGRGRADARPNMLATGRAAEALSEAERVGGSYSVIWKRHIRWLQRAVQAEAGKVDLALEFAAGGEPALNPEGEKQVYPASWPLWGLDEKGRSADRGMGLATTAGLRMVLAAEAGLQRSGKLDQTAAGELDGFKRQGLAWIQKYLSFRSVPPAEGAWCRRVPQWLFEVGEILSACRVEKIGGADWYALGAFSLLREQKEDGSWDSGRGEPVVDTAYAILFLSKSFSPE